MRENIKELTRTAVAFHGHCCPGLTIGILACNRAREHLSRAQDEEVVAVVENNSCMADAVQALTGCTFGKGNLLFRDWGKMAVSFHLREAQRAFRVVFLGNRPEDMSKEDYVGYLEAHPELFRLDEIPYSELPPAEVHPSLPCDHCREPTMATRLVGQLCIPCSNQEGIKKT